MPVPCEGCQTPMHPWEILQWDVCLACTKARHRAVVNHGRCSCGSKRVEGEVIKHLGRSWVPCVRCLGTIRQLS